MHFAAAERSFYRQVQEEAAVPAREALVQHQNQSQSALAPADPEDEAGPSTPSAPSHHTC